MEIYLILIEKFVFFFNYLYKNNNKKEKKYGRH